MARQLLVYLGEYLAGTLTCVVRASSFEYSGEYLELVNPTPLSLSMPVRPGVFPPEIVDPFLWGLLPDSPETLQRWALLASPRADEHNPFSLLKHYGRDCAGAVQFLDPADAGDAGVPGPTQWLNEHEIGAQLRALNADPNAWTFTESEGRFSLAGAQAKFALLRQGERWGRPSGATPTTHIIKPGIPEFRENALNEHVCMSLAAQLGLGAARTRIESFDGEHAIVVERYDRRWVHDRVVRVHQEDFCQALSVVPSQKYQDDGGPSIARMARLIRAAQRKDQADETVGKLLTAVAFNWLIAAPDAHAKNYSILLSGPSAALAPLYDIASIAPYDRYDPERARIAQSVDGHYRICEIGAKQWRAQAVSLGLDGEHFIESVRRLIATAPREISSLCSSPDVVSIDEEFAQVLETALLRRVADAERSLG